MQPGSDITNSHVSTMLRLMQSVETAEFDGGERNFEVESTSCSNADFYQILRRKPHCK